jgi:hypothetical protein
LNHTSTFRWRVYEVITVNYPSAMMYTIGTKVFKVGPSNRVFVVLLISERRKKTV